MVRVAQIGKTGAFLGLIDVLRRRLVPDPEPIGPIDPADSDDGGDGGADGGVSALEQSAYPVYCAMQARDFEHHNRNVPKNGKYGDLAVDQLWEYYKDDGPSPAPSELLKAGRGTTASDRAGGAVGAGRADETWGRFIAARRRAPAENPAPAGVLHAPPAAGPTSPTSVGSWSEKDIKLPSADGAGSDVRCKLHLADRSLENDWAVDWADGGAVRLKFLGGDDARVHFPILMPSHRPHDPSQARLDLAGAQ